MPAVRFESRSESSETVRGATCFDAERARRLRRFLGMETNAGAVLSAVTGCPPGLVVIAGCTHTAPDMSIPPERMRILDLGLAA
jgi:hypothetical protein